MAKNFFKFFLGVVGILMLLSITLGFFATSFIVAGIAFDYGIPASYAIGIYAVVAIVLVWYGFYSS